jgi:hypothetical protein
MFFLQKACYFEVINVILYPKEMRGKTQHIIQGLLAQLVRATDS